jgi:hypothetical protein
MPIPWGAIIGAGGQIAGAIAANRAAGRAQETGLNTNRDAVGTSQYGVGQNAQMQAGQLDLSRQQFGEEARSRRARQAMIGDLLANIQDINVSVPGIQNASVTGGLRPSAMGELGRGAGSELSKQALLRLLQGDTFTGGEILPMPGLTPTPQANGLDRLLSVGGSLGSLSGAIAPYLGGGGDNPTIPGVTGVPAGIPGQQPLPPGLDPRYLNVEDTR